MERTLRLNCGTCHGCWKIFFFSYVLGFDWGIHHTVCISVGKCTCYTFHGSTNNRGKSWTESRRKCNETDADLVAMETKEEWEFILKQIKLREQWSDEWYIGLTKLNGAWTWVSGERLQNNVKGKWPWQPHEPNRDGNVAVMARNYPRQTEGLFNDLDGSDKKGFICEIETGWCLFRLRKLQSYD